MLLMQTRSDGIYRGIRPVQCANIILVGLSFEAICCDGYSRLFPIISDFPQISELNILSITKNTKRDPVAVYSLRLPPIFDKLNAKV